MQEMVLQSYQHAPCSRIFDLQNLLLFNVSKVWPHIEFNDSRVGPIRHADRKITHAASAKLHLLLFLFNRAVME